MPYNFSQYIISTSSCAGRSYPNAVFPRPFTPTKQCEREASEKSVLTLNTQCQVK